MFRTDAIFQLKVDGHLLTCRLSRHLSEVKRSRRVRADRWGMLFSAPKSKHLPIRSEAQQSPSVFMKGVPIPQVRTHKHLGLIFNSTYTWNDHISNLYTTCARMTGILSTPWWKHSIIVYEKKNYIYSCHSLSHRICLRGMEWRTDSKTPTLTRLIFEKTWNYASSPSEEIRLPHSCASLQNTWKVSSRSFVLITSLPHIEHIWLFAQKALLSPKLLEIEKEIVREVAWGDKPYLKEIDRSQSTNQSAELNERLPDLCFAICRFSQVRFITPSHLMHNLFFYFQ